MTRAKQVKTIISIVFISCFCVYTFHSVMPVRQTELSRIMNDKPGKSKERIQTSKSTIDEINDGNLDTLRLRTSLKKQNSLKCYHCNYTHSGFKKQSIDLTMASLDKQLRNHLRLTKNEKYLNAFRPKLQDRQALLLSKIVATFDSIMSENGMTYFLYGGSLIGSYRHHGLIPWDDDADVIMSFSQRLHLYRLLESLDMDIRVSFHPVHYWKLYHKDGEVIRGMPWKYPFLDIFFYDQNETHLWDIAPQYRDQFIFSKAAIFPLRQRPFMGLSVFVPKDIKTVMSTGYKISECHSGDYVHRWERDTRSTIVPCSWLLHLFPFVERVYMNGGCNETLWYKGKPVGVFFDWDVMC